MKKRFAALAFGLLLAACGTTIGNLVTTGTTSGIQAPKVGQWVAYGGNEPTPVNGSWPIPCCNGSQYVGYFYTQLPVVPAIGMTLTLNYTYTANNPVYVQVPASGGNSETDTNPPTIHLFLWRKGDDLSCTATNVVYGPDGHTVVGRNGGFADYRLFAGRTLLVPGANQTISIKLDNADWTNCWGTNPLAIGDALNNLLGVGVTFGGQNFAGHAFYLSSGTARFTVNNISVRN